MEYIKSYFNNLISNSSLITIPIATYLGYLITYLFELESAKFYNIPAYLIQIELLQVILTAVVIYLFLFLVANIIFELAYLITILFPFLNKINTLSPKIAMRRMYHTRTLLIMGFCLLMLISPRFLAKYIEGEKDKFFYYSSKR